MRNSALYEGRVRHRRLAPVMHEFGYRHLYLYLDLDELPGLFRGRWLWSYECRNLASFRRADHFGDPRVPLRESVAALVRERTGRAPAGPIRLLTQVRHLGFVFNPVSFWFCFDAEDRRVETVLAEITNTPWGERHVYVLPRETATEDGGRLRWRFPKEFHISPFLGMEVSYDWSFGEPGAALAIDMKDLEAGETVLAVSLRMRRRALDGRGLARALLLHPAMSFGVIAAIYWQALVLRCKGAPFHEHPRLRARQAGEAR